MGPTAGGQVALGAEHLAAWMRLRTQPETIRRYQERALLRLIRQAVRVTPYYVRRFAAVGLEMEDIRSLDDLQRIPISEKSELRQAEFADRLAAGVRRSDLTIHETSGSTGEPLLTARTPAEELRLAGRRLRALMLSGLRPWMRRVHLGSTPTRNLAHRAGLFPVWNAPLGEPPERTLERLREVRPAILKGPPTAIELLVEAFPHEMRELELRVVFTGAEQLSRRTRQRIEGACGCRVVDFYGAVECNLVAWECVRCGLYHTCDDSVIVEIVRDGRPAAPGEEGEVVLTVLHCHAMPILRYRLGDIVKLPSQNAGCGIGFGSIQAVHGRIVDYLRFDGAPPLSPYRLMDELDAIKDLHRYRVEQTGSRSVRIDIQPSSGDSAEAVAAKVIERCQAVLPLDVELEVLNTPQLPISADQKRRFVRARSPHVD